MTQSSIYNYQLMGCNFSENVTDQARPKPVSNTYISFRLIKAFSVFLYETQAQEPWQIFCRIKIGETEKSTQPKSETTREIPSWKDQIMTFKIPSDVENGIIEVYQIHLGKTTKLGYVDFDIDVISEGPEIHEYSERLISCVEKKSIGSLTFQTIGSKNSHVFFEEPFSAVGPRKTSQKQVENFEEHIWETKNANGMIIFHKQSKKQTEETQIAGAQQEKKQRQKIKRKLLQPLPPLPPISPRLKMKKFQTTIDRQYRLEPMKCQNEEDENKSVKQ